MPEHIENMLENYYVLKVTLDVSPNYLIYQTNSFISYLAKIRSSPGMRQEKRAQLLRMIDAGIVAESPVPRRYLGFFFLTVN